MKHLLPYPLFERNDVAKDEEIIALVNATISEINRAIQQDDVVADRGPLDNSGTFTIETPRLELVILQDTYRKPMARYSSPDIDGVEMARVELFNVELYNNVKNAISEWKSNGTKPTVSLSDAVRTALYHELVHFSDDFEHGLTKSSINLQALQKKVVDKRYKKYSKAPHLIPQGDAMIRRIANNDAQDGKFRVYANADPETNAVFMQTTTQLEATGTFDEFWKAFVAKLPWALSYYTPTVQKRFKKRLYDLYVRKKS